MLHRITFLAGLSLAVLVGSAVPTRSAAAADSSAKVVSRLDKDHDRTLDWAEVQAGADARFDALNKDSDATLDPTETRGVIGKAAFRAADPDHDGTLSKQEYFDLAKQLFRKADVDNDGTLTSHELDSASGRRLKMLIEQR